MALTLTGVKLIQSGESLAYVKEQMGHSSISTRSLPISLPGPMAEQGSISAKGREKGGSTSRFIKAVFF